MKKPVQKPKSLTLADCHVSHPANCRCGGILRCLHCDTEFPSHARVEVYEDYIIVYCRQCWAATPFKLEKAS